MNIFFDMDYTILGGMDGSLRPRVPEVFQRLIQDGHEIYVWSGTGIRTAEIQRFNLGEYVTGIFHKPLEDFEEKIKARGIPVHPDLVVDDYPEIVGALGGILVRPYNFAKEDDQEMERVYNIISAYAQNGHSDDSAFRPPGTRPEPPSVD